MVAVGEKIRSFELPDQEGSLIRFDELLGKGPLVFFFYPADETPVCTKEACSFRDAHAELVGAGAQVFGISGDSVASHKAFAAHHRLPYRLLADVDNKVRNDVFGVKRAFLGLSAGRATYVVDQDGVVRLIHEAALESQGHVDRALEAVRRLRAS